MAFKYQLGVYVIDRVTGLSGVIIGRSDHLTGCNRYSVQPPVDKDGKYLDGFWIDEHALEVDAKKQRLVLSRDEAQPPG